VNNLFMGEQVERSAMSGNLTAEFGANLKKERERAEMTQAALSKAARVNRLRIVRSEKGLYDLRFDEVMRLAEALKVPVQRFISGQLRPSNDLSGIAVELFDLGIRDYVVAGAIVPGAFRHPEEVVTLALMGDCPDSRLIDAMPFVLATRRLTATLLISFALVHDERVMARLGWLSDLTTTLSRAGRFPVPVRNAMGLSSLIHQARPAPTPDDLGHPAVGAKSRPLLWRRWNITYGGTMDGFTARATELASGGYKANDESE
jgi:transcriptional regulator with XRE-family HTH domain